MSIFIRNWKCLTSRLQISTSYQLFYKTYSSTMIKVNAGEAILLYEEGSTKFDIHFRYVNPALKIDKQVCFHRCVDEPISKFVSRIENKVKYFETVKQNRMKNKKFKQEENEINVSEIHIEFKKDDSVLYGDVPCKTLLENNSNIRLLIADNEYILKRNVPCVITMKLPPSILVGFPVYPSKFETLHLDKAMSSFKWYSCKNDEWKCVGYNYIYLPTVSDLGCKLKISCLPKNNEHVRPEVEAISADVVQPGPGPCPFETRHKFTTNKLSGKSFRVLSYNILADIYSETDLSKDTLYPYCPQSVLSIDYRKLLILKELIGFNSDIICLQEVTGSVYKNDLITLNQLNYDGIFNLKNDLHEGLAIFYNQERFVKLYSDFSVISQGTGLNEFETTWSEIKNENIKQTFVNRNTIIQTVALKSKENPEILVIGNTHLYFRPEADRIRLLQAYYGLIYLDELAKKVKKENPEYNVSILYCGDFNSVPESTVFQLITQKSISDYCNDLQSNLEQCLNTSIKHDINLDSACGTPKYTNYTATFAGCLDYIFYQTDNLEVEQVIPMPSKNELSLYTGLPSIVFPSDHISLCVDLKWSK